MSQDEFGVFARIKGVLEEKAKVAVKSHFDLSDENFVKFTYETKVSYYNVSNTNPQTDSLWMSHLPDVTFDGRFNDSVSFVQVFFEDLDAFTEHMSLLSQDYLQLKQFKIFLQKHKSVKADSIEKEKLGADDAQQQILSRL